MNRPRLLAPLTLLIMLTGSISVFTFGVLAPFLTRDLAIGPGQLGLVTSALFLTAAVASPRGGRLVDRLSARTGILVIAVLSVTAHIAIATAPGVGILLVAAVAGGVANALTNPVTNQLVARAGPSEQQALLLGIKQSGVPAAAALAGAVLPSVAIVAGWRTAAITPMVLSVTLLAAASLAPSAARDGSGGAPFAASRSFRLLRWYTALMGGAAGALHTFLVLFAVESAGFAPGQAGLAASLMGVMAVVARVAWAYVAQRSGATAIVLTGIAVLGAVSGAVLLTASTLGPGPVWIASGLAGASIIAWQAVVMLAVLQRSTPTTVGAASGYVWRGFFLGLLVTPVSLGALVEATSTYTALWLAVAVMSLSAVLPAISLRRWPSEAVNRTLPRPTTRPPRRR